MTQLDYGPHNSAEALEHEPENTKYLDTFNSAEDLVNNWYHTHYKGSKSSVFQNRVRKLNHIYDNGSLSLSGHGLELAFGFGESIYVLSKWYDNIVIDGFDFMRLLGRIMPFIKELNGPKVGELWIGDARSTGKPDNHYDFINSCSFFEHLPENVFWPVIKECYRVLKPGGIMGCYLDPGPNYGEHVRCVPVEQTKQELESIGFITVNDYVYRKPQ